MGWETLYLYSLGQPYLESCDEVLLVLVAPAAPQHEAPLVVPLVQRGLAQPGREAARHLGGRVGRAVSHVLEEAADVAVRHEAGDALADVVDEADGVAQEVRGALGCDSIDLKNHPKNRLEMAPPRDS